MTERLKHAFSEASKLPDAEQEALAALLLEEMASERRWTDAFATSKEQLAALADEALAEFERGKTVPFEHDRDLTHD